MSFRNWLYRWMHADAVCPDVVPPVPPSSAGLKPYIAIFDDKWLEPLPNDVDLSNFGRPSDYRIGAYFIPAFFGTKECEEVVARIVLGLSVVNEWKTVSYFGFRKAFLKELMTYEEEPGRYAPGNSSTAWFMAGQPQAYCRQLDNALVLAIKQLVHEGFIGQAYRGADVLLWPLPPMLESLGHYRSPT